MDRPPDIALKIKFRHICDMLESIHKAGTIAKKEKYFCRYYNSFLKYRETFRRENGLDGPETGSSSFYSVLRCLMPSADNARKAYGLQKPTIGRVYIKVLQLSPDSRKAQILSNGNYFGDYAEVVYKAVAPRCLNEASDLTLHDIHKMLDSIADDDIRNTEMVITRLIEIGSALEQKWIVRLLLKSMNLAMGEQRLFALLHPQAKAVYQRCSSLERLCCFIADNPIDRVDDDSAEVAKREGAVSVNLNDIIEPFQIIKPMLCERFSGDIQPLMADDVLYVETKMDGERFQLHYANGRFAFYSRNGNDYTSSFGADYQSGPLTPQLASLLPSDMSSLILDGEMMVWDSFVKEFRHKGENTDVKHLAEHRNWWPCFVVYDILYFNGRSLLDLPYIQRTHKMRQLIKEKTGVLQLMKPHKIPSVDVFRQMFQKAMDHHEEGVVVKKQNSVYMPGTRGGGGWYKVKSDYIEGMTTDFDLLVIGGFYNSNRNYVNSFLLGVLKGDSQKFEVFSVGKVGNMTHQRVILNNELKPHWHDVIQDPPPLWYHYVASKADGRPDVWIEPRNSVILQIKAADLAPSSAFAMSKSLHFPRVQAWRNDKTWYDCMSWQEYSDIMENKRGLKKIHKREATLEDFQTNVKLGRLTAAQQRELALQKYEKKFDPTQVTKTSDMFNGFSICVLSGSEELSVTAEQLKALVVANGGEIVEYPLRNDAKSFAIAGDITPRVKVQQDTRRYNIVRLQWFRRCCELQTILQMQRRDFIYYTKELRAQFDELYDCCGDSYTMPVSAKELQTLIDDISDEMLAGLPVSDDEIALLEEKVFARIPADFYRKTCAFFYTKDELAQCTYQWLGGVCHTFEDALRVNGLLYIFIEASCESFVRDDFKAWLSKYFAKKLKHLKIVDVKWIMDSFRAKRLLDVNEYTWLQL